MRAALQNTRFTPAPMAAAVALVLALTAGQITPAHAQSATPAAVAFNIPAQGLGQALNELARQANLQLSFAADLVAGKTAPAISGQLTPRQALDRLLAGSGLEASVDGSAVLVRKPPRTASEPTELPAMTVTSLRENRVSKGATGLPMEIKETPQSITTFTSEEMQDYGVTDSNKALQMVTGINVEQYETNRATFESRGYEIQLTQVDGLGMTNSWGTVVGKEDTFLYDKIEVIRGANGLLTGVGNASGTVNYVRKRPTNKDQGEFLLEGGSWDKKRVALDYNKVLTEDGTVAGRVVLIQQDKNSWTRSLNDRNTTLYGVVDAQVGSSGVLTVGVTDQNNHQKSPMWGSLTLNYPDGSQASFDTNASTSQDWTYWNTKSTTGFVEYTQFLGDNWEAKFTYNKRHAEEETALLYAYSPTTGSLNYDNTGLVGWPYRSFTTTESDLFDLNLSGSFSLLGRKHELITGLSHSIEKVDTDTWAVDASDMLNPLPAFPFGGSVYKEPKWGERSPSTGSEQRLTRLYGATRLALSDEVRAILGINAVKLSREGSSRYGSATTTTEYPDTRKASPYYGLTWDITRNLLGYVSYSEIFQNQDQTDFGGAYLDPMKGVNREVGVKADWLDKRLLTTASVFSAKQEGLATYEGLNAAGNYYYVPKDVKSTGFELEATGKLARETNLALGFTRLKLTGPDGNDIYEWVPRTQVKARFDSAVPGLPELRLGLATRWNSDARKTGGARQDAYFVSDAFARYQITKELSARLNLNNLFDKKYVTGIAYGAVYGEPRSAYLTLDYKL
jgi:outer membrane receptor for ferric coprogen and ferric-rhodotorulic acid